MISETRFILEVCRKTSFHFVSSLIFFKDSLSDPKFNNLKFQVALINGTNAHSVCRESGKSAKAKINPVFTHVYLI